LGFGIEYGTKTFRQKKQSTGEEEGAGKKRMRRQKKEIRPGTAPEK